MTMKQNCSKCTSLEEIRIRVQNSLLGWAPLNENGVYGLKYYRCKDCGLVFIKAIEQ